MRSALIFLMICGFWQYPTQAQEWAVATRDGGRLAPQGYRTVHEIAAWLTAQGDAFPRHELVVEGCEPNVVTDPHLSRTELVASELFLAGVGPGRVIVELNPAGCGDSVAVWSRRAPPRLSHFDMPRLHFESGSTEITALHRWWLRRTRFHITPETRVLVDGHTDTVGPDGLNQALSEQRAQAVADQLIFMGVSENMITVRGSADRLLARPSTGPEMLNRRVSVHLRRPRSDGSYTPW
jgi:hypothetical protein